MSTQANLKSPEQTHLENGLFSLAETAIPLMHERLVQEGYTAVFLLNTGRHIERLNRIRPPYGVTVIISDKSGVVAGGIQSRQLLREVQEDGGDAVFSPPPDTEEEILAGKGFLDLTPHVPIALETLRARYPDKTRRKTNLEITQSKIKDRLDRLKSAGLSDTFLYENLLQSLKNITEAKRPA